MSYSTQGASNRTLYDCCAFTQSLQQSVKPLDFQMYFGAVENCNSCIDDKKWYKQDREIVDVESQLWKITQPMSKCDQFKYSPTCPKDEHCMSTFDSTAPKVLSPSLCPIVYNNIPRQTSAGYTLPDTNICNPNGFMNVKNNNPAEQQNQRLMELGARQTKLYDTESNMPLYNGTTPSGTYSNQTRSADLSDSLYSGGMQTGAWGSFSNAAPL